MSLSKTPRVDGFIEQWWGDKDLGYVLRRTVEDRIRYPRLQRLNDRALEGLRRSRLACAVAHEHSRRVVP
jgi:hypothetical protein